MATTTLPVDKFDKNTVLVRPATPPSRVPLDKLAPLPGFNTREKGAAYSERVSNLTASMAQHGFYEDKPLGVTMLPNDDTIYVYDGEHRFDAARAASLDGVEFGEGIPVAWAKEGATVKDLTVHLVRGNDGAALTPVEMAAVVRRLVDMGLDKTEIATEIGRTVRHVENLMVLAGANKTVKTAVAEGKIAAAEAVKLVRKHGSKEAGEKITAAVKAAEEKGKAKATPGTMSAPKVAMKTITLELSMAAGTEVADLVKAISTKIRAELPMDDDEKLVEDGALVIRATIVDRAKEAEKAEAAQKRAEEKAAREAERIEKAAKREAEKAEAAAKKAAEPKPEPKPKAPAKKAAPKAEEAGDKAPARTKTRRTARKPAEAPAEAVATEAAANTESAATGATPGPDDGNNGL